MKSLTPAASRAAPRSSRTRANRIFAVARHQAISPSAACAPGPASRPPRCGIALPAALISLAVISLFIAGSAFFAMQEARAGHNALSERQALEAAEYGATAVMRDWSPDLSLSTAVGGTLGPFTTALAGATAVARATRSSMVSFWVASEGTAGAASLGAEARRFVNVLYRLNLAQPDVAAALTVRDSVEVQTGGLVEGADSVVAGPGVIASCATPSPSMAGVAAPDTLRICDGRCGGATAGNVRGLPARLEDPAAADSLRYLVFGDRTWQSLTAAADVVLPPNVSVTPGPQASAGACQRAVPANWGDPARASPCANYFPVIWARGDVTIAGGRGQGILLAEGDLRLAAGASFVGLVIARDDIVTGVGGGSILGAAFASDSRSAPADHTVIGSGGLIRYSSCGLESALYGSALLKRVEQRAWAELP
jgi:hypothetical protein